MLGYKILRLPYKIFRYQDCINNRGPIAILLVFQEKDNFSGLQEECVRIINYELRDAYNFYAHTYVYYSAVQIQNMKAHAVTQNRAAFSKLQASSAIQCVGHDWVMILCDEGGKKFLLTPAEDPVTMIMQWAITERPWRNRESYIQLYMPLYHKQMIRSPLSMLKINMTWFVKTQHNGAFLEIHVIASLCSRKLCSVILWSLYYKYISSYKAR